MDADNPQPGPMPPVLVLIRDTRLREEVRRVAAAAARALEERESAAGRHAWTAAPMVILDTESARELAEAAYVRRAGVVLVTEGEPELPDWQAAAAVGAERVVALPGAAVGLIEKFAEHGEPRATGGVVVAVAGACGGAGASVLASATALRAAAGAVRREVVLVDAAPLAGGLDLLLGIETTPGVRWPDLVIEDGRVAAPALHSALPSAAPGLAVLSCGRGGAGRLPSPVGASAMRAVLEACRGAGDLVICDVSGERGPHAEQALDRADLVVLVTRATLRAAAAAECAATHLTRRNPNIGLVVRGPAPGGLRGGELAEILDLPLLAAIRADPALPSRLERGGLRAPRRGGLREAADAILALVDAPVGGVR